MSCIKVHVIGLGVRYFMTQHVISWWDSHDDESHNHDDEVHDKSKTTMMVMQWTIVTDENHNPQHGFPSMSHLHLSDTPESIMQQLNRSQQHYA